MYDTQCNDCKHETEQINLAVNPRFKRLLNVAEKAFKKLHKSGKYHPDYLGSVKEYQDLIFETNGILSRAFKDNDLSPKMLESLENDVFYFSGLKTHAQLFEASRQLLTEDKTIKSFRQFSKDISSIKKNYNENYLEAEYDFAVGSVQMAERYEQFSDSDRYLLQYRTAADDKVRVSHQALHDITLPKSDAFWDQYFPPNGWRCRCTTVEVLASLNEKSDSKDANKKGDVATTQIGQNGKNKLEIFRFNAGRQKVVFPPGHPYQKVAGSKTVKPIILTMINDDGKEKRKAKNKEVKQWIQAKIPMEGKMVNLKNFDTGSAILLRKNLRSINDHFTEPRLKDLTKDVFKWLKKCEFTGSASLDDSQIKKSVKNINSKKQRGVTGYNYYRFEWNNETFRLNVELIEGKEHPFSVAKIINAE